MFDPDSVANTIQATELVVWIGKFEMGSPS